MADIKITFEEVRTKAKQLRKYNSNLSDYLEQIKTAINSLEADWTSDSSETIRAKITAMQSKFDSYKDVVESYAKFLDDTVAMWEATEAANKANANQFV